LAALDAGSGDRQRDRYGPRDRRRGTQTEAGLEVAATCAACERPIAKGDKFSVIDTEVFHRACVTNSAQSVLTRTKIALLRARQAVNDQAHADGLRVRIRELEDELGVQLFVRHGKRYTQMTEAGERILEIANRLLDEADALRKVGSEFSEGHAGTLSIAATHTQARYVLPAVLARFREEFPAMQFKLLQGNPEQVADYVVHGDATFGLATETLDDHPSLDTRPAYAWRHCLIVPPTHAFASLGRQPTLAELAGQPLITYTAQFAGRRGIDAAFVKLGQTPNVVLEAIDSDVIKAYVELGFGVGVIADVAVDAERDRNLVRIEQLAKPGTGHPQAAPGTCGGGGGGGVGVGKEE
jgi:DNA-binding transcriptional LysR family regulator